MESKLITYFTEEDLIDRYTNRRKNMKREDVEDLYKALIKYLIYKMEDNNNPKMGFHLRGFFSFLHKRLKISNLKMSHTSPKYKRAEEQLHHYLSGHQRLKIEND